MKHIQHLLIVAVVGLVVAVAAVTTLSALTPADFGAQPPGWSYRASSLKEHAESPPLAYADEASCAQKNCHGGENPKAYLNIKLRGRHDKIGCQVCHGPAQSHVENGGTQDSPVIWKSPKPLTGEERAKLPKEEQQKLDDERAAFHIKFCLGCHQQLAGRPESVPQIPSFEKHRKDNGDGTEAGCTSCHSPHKPAM